jgi:hypothetical protein
MVFGRLGIEEAGGLGGDGGVEDEFGGVGVGGGLDVEDFEGHEELRRGGGIVAEYEEPLTLTLSPEYGGERTREWRAKVNCKLKLFRNCGRKGLQGAQSFAHNTG